MKNLESDTELQLKAERLFEILSQKLIDICSHIISESNIDPPKTYSECMKKLHSLNKISEDIAYEIASMIKMRNIIVHPYGKIDYYLLLEGLRKIKNDYLEFLR